MKLSMLRKFSGLLLLAGLTAGSEAHAYSMPSAYLVQQVTKKHRSLKGLRVKTRITGTEGQLKEVFWLDLVKKVAKGRVLDSNDQEIYAYHRNWNENDSLAASVLFESDPVKLARALIAAGIPVVTDDVLTKLATEEERRAVEKTGINRLNGLVGWTIGKGMPSFWVLKDAKDPRDEFTPLKLFYRPDGRDTEIRFEETKTLRDFPYPRAITLFRGGDYVLKGDAMEVMVNPDLTDMKKITVAGIPPVPDSLDSSTRRLIEAWIQWIR